MVKGHYFEVEPTAASRPASVSLELPDLRADLVVDRGVFSASGIDPGSEVLLRTTSPPASGHLLDLGCGYGPIACTLATRSPGATVWAVDVNRRALELTAANARALGLDNVVATAPEGVPPDLRLAGLWSNPPVRIGKPALEGLLSKWLGHLEPTAVAWLVVHKHLGADSLASWLAAQGWRVQRTASKRGYRVLSVRPGQPGAWSNEP